MSTVAVLGTRLAVKDIPYSFTNNSTGLQKVYILTTLVLLNNGLVALASGYDPKVLLHPCSLPIYLSFKCVEYQES